MSERRLLTTFEYRVGILYCYLDVCPRISYKKYSYIIYISLPAPFFSFSQCYHRGAVVEWLVRLGYGAESRRKVVSSRLGFAMRRLKNSLCQPSSKWVPFSNQGRIRQRKERDGLCLSSAVPRIQWDSNPHCPYSY